MAGSAIDLALFATNVLQKKYYTVFAPLLPIVGFTTGTVGASMTEVTKGLAVGDRVVLADLDRALPTSSTTTTTRFGGAAGGGFGAGGGAGGFGAGGFGAGAGAPPAGAGARPGG